MSYGDEELERLLADVESDIAERKESLKGDAPREVREAICAFANDLPDHRQPGVAFIGAHDDGSPIRISVTDELLRQLADMKTDGNIVPPPTLIVEKRTLRGAPMAVVTVVPSDSPPVRFKGRIHIRIGPRRGIATAQDERILNEKRRHKDRPYDVRPVHGASMADLDIARFSREYLAVAVAQDVIERNDRSDLQRLAATKMIASLDEPVPTVLGLLVIGESTRTYFPGAYVQFLRIQGTKLEDRVVDEDAIDGTVADVIRRLDEKLAAHNRVAVDFATRPVEERTALYPVAALQQLTRNAVMHRNYEGTNAPIRVTWYDDRIEILNPGGPFGEVTPANFGTPGLTDYRNPNLAEAMRALGFVQKFGVGLTLARSTLEKNGNPPPEFRPEHGHVLVIVRPRP